MNRDFKEKPQKGERKFEYVSRTYPLPMRILSRGEWPANVWETVSSSLPWKNEQNEQKEGQKCSNRVFAQREQIKTRRPSLFKMRD